MLADAQAYMESVDRPRDRARIYLAQARRARDRGDTAGLEQALAAAAEQLDRLESRDLHQIRDTLRGQA